MTGNIVARRYARALFAIGKEQGMPALEAFGKDLSGLANIIAESPQLLKLLRNPLFSVKEKKGVIAKLLEQLAPSGMIINFCNFLADKERLAYLPEIAGEFNGLLDAEKGVIRGELITAIALDGAKQDSLKAALEKQAGRKLILDFNANPEILGGVVLKVGDMVMDASLRAQLDILKENIKRGE